jgi:hypothetical protein
MIIEVTAHREKWEQMHQWLCQNMPGQWNVTESIGTIFREVEFYQDRDATLFMLRWNSK